MTAKKPVKKKPVKKKPAVKAKKRPAKKLAKRRTPKKLTVVEFLLDASKKVVLVLEDSKPLSSADRRQMREWKKTSDEMKWEIHNGGIDVVTGGACPVQSKGTVDGHPVYFRARGDAWTLDIAQKGGDPHKSRWEEEQGWQLFGDYGVWPDAGWISGKHSRACFLAAVESWRAAGGEKAPFGQVKLDPRWPVPGGPEK